MPAPVLASPNVLTQPPVVASPPVMAPTPVMAPAPVIPPPVIPTPPALAIPEKIVIQEKIVVQKPKPVEYSVKSNAMSICIEAEVKEEVQPEPVIQIVEKIVEVKEERKW